MLSGPAIGIENAKPIKNPIIDMATIFSNIILLNHKTIYYRHKYNQILNILISTLTI
jgi:hypothetical protein